MKYIISIEDAKTVQNKLSVTFWQACLLLKEHGSIEAVVYKYREK